MKTYVCTLMILTLCVAVPSLGQEVEESQGTGTLVKTHIISGGVGMSGVTMQGLPGNPRTDENGCYRAIVKAGWSGLVVPVKTGYTFEPPSRVYETVTEGLTNQNYRAEVIMVTISDRIAFGDDLVDEPIEGIVVTAKPGGYTATTDSDGWYEVKVPFGWSGELHMAKQGFAFHPSSTSFENVTEDITKGETSSRRSNRFATRRSGSRGRYRQPFGPLSTDEILVIPTQEVAPKAFAETAEDMRVMGHILREELSEPRTIRGVLYDYGDFFGGPDRPVKATYLQGYGALFVVRLDTPFSFSQGSSVQARKESEPKVDPVWQRAQQTLRGSPSPRSRWSAQEDRVSFEQFKGDLLKTLKHATNIRHIDPNEQVILTVIGQNGPSGPSAGDVSFSFEGGSGGFVGGSGGFGGGYSSGGGSFYSYGGSSGRSVAGGATAPAQGRQAPATVLTLQAAKADIDAFAKGDIDFEQFQAKSKTFSY